MMLHFGTECSTTCNKNDHHYVTWSYHYDTDFYHFDTYPYKSPSAPIVKTAPVRDKELVIRVLPV